MQPSAVFKPPRPSPFWFLETLRAFRKALNGVEQPLVYFVCFDCLYVFILHTHTHRAFRKALKGVEQPFPVLPGELSESFFAITDGLPFYSVGRATQVS